MKVKLTRTLNFTKAQVGLLKRLAKYYGYDSWRDWVDSFVFSEGETGLLNAINDRENYELWKEEEEEELAEVRDNASDAALVMHVRKFYKGAENEQS